MAPLSLRLMFDSTQSPPRLVLPSSQLCEFHSVKSFFFCSNSLQFVFDSWENIFLVLKWIFWFYWTLSVDGMQIRCWDWLKFLLVCCIALFFLDYLFHKRVNQVIQIAKAVKVYGFFVQINWNSATGFLCIIGILELVVAIDSV